MNFTDLMALANGKLGVSIQTSDGKSVYLSSAEIQQLFKETAATRNGNDVRIILPDWALNKLSKLG